MNRKEMLQLLKEGKDPLEISIQKWQERVDGKPDSDESDEDTCALCETHPCYGLNMCPDCPVAIAVKTNGKFQSGCTYSPYGKYSYAEKSRWRKYWAKKELAFLISLRPSTVPQIKTGEKP